MQTALEHGSDAGSRDVGGTGFQITMRDKGFDVDVRWAQALMDGDQSLEWITESTQRRSLVCARARMWGERVTAVKSFL